MTANTWRNALATHLAHDWDLVIVGGGITGAGILLEASRRGLKALLVEQRDFAWGTSSRSSKLVHGGLRYLKQGQLRLTRESVRERQNLLREAPGLVDAQSFAFGQYQGQGRGTGRWVFGLGLAVYDWLASQRARHFFPTDEFLMLAPHIRSQGLTGGMCYQDAKTDDARMVMRVLHEAGAAGGVAVNYISAHSLLRTGTQVTGVELRDAATGNTHRVSAKVVVNATGAWADRLRTQQGAKPKMRPLRGSHLVLPSWRLPLAQAIGLMHPVDGRPVFAYPWEGITLVGTTDVDHRTDLQLEARITADEVHYLMQALHHQFPQLDLGLNDIIATYAGVRPVVDTGQADPSKEGRDHAVWLEDGLLTVTGGKLTTFRVIALDALRHAAPLLAHWKDRLEPSPIFSAMPPLRRIQGLSTQQVQRLQGRYGSQSAALVAVAQPGELMRIGDTDMLWAELRWAARSEAVVHLEDLLLRRTRLGLLLRKGGAEHLERIAHICQIELGWSEAQWASEQAAYLALWQQNYDLPPHDQIADWRTTPVRSPSSKTLPA